MAIAGGATTAYYIWVGSDGAPHTTARLRYANYAMTSATWQKRSKTNNGERLLIAGGDIMEVRKAWGAVNTKNCMRRCGGNDPHNRRAHYGERRSIAAQSALRRHDPKHRLKTAATIPLRTCEQCGNPIPYNRRYGLGEYAKRIYCSVSCASKVGQTPQVPAGKRTHHSTPRSASTWTTPQP